MIGSASMDPLAVRVFTVDWSEWPFPAGTRIAGIDWKVPQDFKIIQQSIVGYKANVKLDFVGVGTDRDYIVECHMTTTDSASSPPMQDSRRFGIKIIPR